MDVYRNNKYTTTTILQHLQTENSIQNLELYFFNATDSIIPVVWRAKGEIILPSYRLVSFLLIISVSHLGVTADGIELMILKMSQFQISF